MSAIFKEHEKHEAAIMGEWRKNIQAARKPIRDRMKLLKRGAQSSHDINKLYKRVRRIYPRGRAAFRVYDLSTPTSDPNRE